MKLLLEEPEERVRVEGIPDFLLEKELGGHVLELVLRLRRHLVLASCRLERGGFRVWGI